MEEDKNWWRRNNNKDASIAGYFGAPTKVIVDHLVDEIRGMITKENFMYTSNHGKVAHNESTSAMPNAVGLDAAIGMIFGGRIEEDGLNKGEDLVNTSKGLIGEEKRMQGIEVEPGKHDKGSSMMCFSKTLSTIVHNTTQLVDGISHSLEVIIVS